jgi:magnesium transporter
MFNPFKFHYLSESAVSSSKKTGMSPGSLVHVGEIFDNETIITLTNYSPTHLEQKIITSVEEMLPYRENKSTTWINVDGLRDVELIRSIGQHFKVHTLVQEDILHTKQRSKFEDYEHYLFMVVKNLSPDLGEFAIDYEQVSILVFKNFIFTFKEKPTLLFDPIKIRIQNSKGRIRHFGSDYLAYVVLDTIVDEYFSLQDSLDELMESIEDELLTNPSSQTLATIQKIRRELIFVRKCISPLRELLSGLQRSDSTLINAKNRRYFADVYDHALRVIEAMESYRELISSMMDIYLSSVNNKMSETMKVLTVFASIFIPLTFIAGVYGMNFEYMPELKLRWAYPALWCFFITISVSLIIYFKQKKWI